MNPEDIEAIDDPHVRERVWRWYREQQSQPDTRPKMFGGIPLKPVAVDNGSENAKKFSEVFRNGMLDTTHIYRKGKP